MSFNEKPQNIPQAGIPAFRYFCQKVLPAVYDDSLSYYELLCKLTSKINDVITTQNTQVDAITELQELYNDLVDYVNNYFDNLDIQTEINNKLDQMAESGELADIVTAYLQVRGVLGYNTVEDLKNATNINDGSFAMTYGKETLNDGYPLLYKIRTITTSDIIDDDNIIKITNSDALVGEKIKIEEFNTIKQSINNLELTEFVVFGDSWSDLSVTDAIWSPIVAKSLNCTLHNYAKNGAGFVKPENNLISTQVSNFINDDSYLKSKVKQIIIMGGINDYRNNVTYSDIITSLISICNTLNTACPIAKILYISNCQYPYNYIDSQFWYKLHNRLSTYIPQNYNFTIATINLQEICPAMELYNSNNYYHLTQNGQRWLATNIVSFLNGGMPIHYYDVRHLENDDIRLFYYGYLVGNNYKGHIIFRPKKVKTHYEIQLNEDEADLPFYRDNLYGSAGLSYNQFIYQILQRQIDISFQMKPNVSFDYNADFTVGFNN